MQLTKMLHDRRPRQISNVIIPIPIITIIINCGRCTKCYDMISFGRDKEDTSVTCLQVRISAGA